MSYTMYQILLISIVGVFTDPGSVPSNAIPLINEDIEDRQLLMRCGICDAYKPPKSHHCK